MSSYDTVTIELSNPDVSQTVISFLEVHEEFVSPKQPNSTHVVVHSGIYLPANRELIRELLTLDEGVSRVGHMQSNDTTDTASGIVYWLEDGEICEFEAAADDWESEKLDEQYGNGTAQQIRGETGFEIYSWWDYSVDGMEKRYIEYLKEDVPQKLVDAGIINDVDDV